MQRSFNGKIVELKDHNHQYCLKCNKIMLYHKVNQICLDCDTGIPVTIKNIQR